MNNSLQAVLFSVLILSWFVDLLAEILNQRSFSVEVPEEFKGVYDPQKYRSAIFYQREKSRFGILASGIQLGALLVFWSSGGFEKVDLASRSLANSPWVMALVFGGILSVLKSVLQLPFSIYDTFVLEAMYGFNRTTPLTFVSDHLKGALLGALLGGAAYLGVIWFFDRTGTQAWLWAWAAFTLFQILLLFLAPAVLMPLFNKFEPLENGPLRDAIGAYARGQDFQLQGIFKMDGSKRSTKANAFFTGFGRFRRLVLFDTLIEKNTIEELVAVLAHEIGHFKCRHILRSLALSILTSGGLFFLLSKFLASPALFEAFGVSHPSTYAGVIFLLVVFSPFFRLMGLFTHALSRRYEFEADDYSARTYGKPESLVSALKKLSVDSLSHLTPHRLKILLDYTHPPVMERISALRARGPRRHD